MITVPIGEAIKLIEDKRVDTHSLIIDHFTKYAMKVIVTTKS